MIDYETMQNTSHGIEVQGFNATVIGNTEKPHTIYFTKTDHEKWYHEKGYKKEYTRKVKYNTKGQATFRFGGWVYYVTPIVG